MDTNLRIRADALGMVAETYENQRVEVRALDTGVTELEVDRRRDRRLLPATGASRRPALADAPPERRASCSAIAARPTHTALGRYDAAKQRDRRAPHAARGRHGRSPAQQGAEPSRSISCSTRTIRLVTLVGKAGTGKTLLALAAGLKRTIEDGAYTRMLVSRPVMPLGRDIGFLPGDVDEKLNPWMQPIFDNLEFLFSSGTQQGPARLRRAARERAAPGRAAHVHPRALAAAAVHHRRRGAEPHAARGEDDHHALAATARRSCSPATPARSTTRTSTARRTGSRSRPTASAARSSPGTSSLAKGERSELAELAANLL